MRGPHSALRRQASPGEEGYILVAVVFMVALVVLSLAIAAPKIASQIQRDRELEAINRGRQYKRALRLYYKKFGNYPTSIDQLQKSNDIRFLRKRYTDPLTGKDDWVPILMGQAKVKPLGFFGQPLAVASAVSPGMGTGSTNLNGSSSSDGSLGSSSAFGSSSSSLGSSSTGMGSMGGTTTPSTTPSGSSSGLYAPDDPSTSTNGSGTSTSSTGSIAGTSSGSSMGSGFSSSSSSSTSSSSSSSSGFSSTLSGGPIVGVKLPGPKASILQYRLKTKYTEWEFVYDPVEEQAAAQASLFGGSGNLNGSNSTGSNSGTGTGFSSGIGGGTSGSGSGTGGSSILGGGNSSFGGSGSSGGFGSSTGSGNTPQ